MSRGPDTAVAAALGGMVALASAMGIGRFIYTPILPFMEASLGLSKAEAGLIASSNYLGYLLGALLVAALPGNKRGWFLMGLGASAATTAAMALASTMLPLLVLRFAGGVASAFVLVFSSILVLERLSAARRPGLFALHFAGVGTGIAVTAVLVFGAAALGGGWRLQWLLGGAFSLLALALASRLVPRERAMAAPAATSGESKASQQLIALVLAYGLFGFGYVITATFISTLVRETPALASIESVVWFAVGLAAIPSVALWAWYGERRGQARSFAVACLVESVGVATSVLVNDALAVLIAAALLGGTFVGITAVGLVYARRLSKSDSQRNLALMTASFGLGQVIGPTFAGYAYSFGDSFVVPSMAAAMALVVAAGLVLGTRSGPRSEAAES